MQIFPAKMLIIRRKGQTVKKRILLIGAFYYRNLGDALLCRAAMEMLSERYDVTLLDIYGRTEFPAVTVTEANRCRDEFGRIVRRLRTRKLLTRFGIVPYDSRKRRAFETVKRQLEREIEKERPAAVVFAGGALLKGVFIHPVSRIEELAAGYGIPVLFNACGIESGMSAAEWKRIEDILRHPCVRFISVRDGYELLQRKIPGAGIYDTYDTALCANRFFRAGPEKRGIGLGIMLSHNFGFDAQAAFWSKLIRCLKSEKYEWYLFTDGAPSDQGFAAYLLSLNHEDESRLLPCPETPEDLYAAVSGFEAIISMRLHSHILAWSSGVPCLAVSWDRKIDDFYEKIGKADNCFTFRSSPGDILSCLRKSMMDKDFFTGKAEREQAVRRNMDLLMDAIG